jgi:renalase
MIIGVIGAGIAGLTAGKELAKAGHDVVIFEKSGGFGGRLATRYAGDENEIRMDHGAPFFTARSIPFRNFVEELQDKKIVDVLDDHFPFFTGEKILDKHADIPTEPYYYAMEGMNQIGKYMSRWVDVQLRKKVNGFTYLGSVNRKKRNWMINFEDFSVMEVDAVIVATSAPQAWGLIENSQDETPFKRIIRNIDTVRYESCHTLMVNLGNQAGPEWKALRCNHDKLRWIINESAKRPNNDNTIFILQSTSSFTSANVKTTENDITSDLLNSFKAITTLKIDQPVWTQLHHWRYRNVRNPLPGNFVEITDHTAPAALTGDYFAGGEENAGTDGMESAYLSGLRLAEAWIEKYPAN